MDITISIRKDIIRDFLRYIGEEISEGHYKMSHLQGVAKLIVSLVQYSDKPVVVKEGSVRLTLPMCESLNTARHKYLYLTEESQAKVNDYLEAAFELDFDRYWLQGTKMRIRQKDIVLAYINSRKLMSLEGDIETIKKRLYRGSLLRLQQLSKQLINRADYTDRLIRESLKKHKFFL